MADRIGEHKNDLQRIIEQSVPGPPICPTAIPRRLKALTITQVATDSVLSATYFRAPPDTRAELAGAKLGNITRPGSRAARAGSVTRLAEEAVSVMDWAVRRSPPTVEKGVTVVRAPRCTVSSPGIEPSRSRRTGPGRGERAGRWDGR